MLKLSKPALSVHSLHCAKNLRCFLLIVLLPLLLLPGCVRKANNFPEEAMILSQGSLGRVEKSAPLYIAAHDQGGRTLRLSDKTRAILANNGFRLTEKPSAAAYILQISILGQGQINADRLKSLVDAGFAQPADFKGSESLGILADMLLVQREIPTHVRPSRARMKNISSRNAISSSQMRLGLLLPAKEKSDLDMPFPESLARELGRILNGQEAP